MWKRIGIGLLVGGLLVAVPGTGAFGAARGDRRASVSAERSRRHGERPDADRRDARQGHQRRGDHAGDRHGDDRNRHARHDREYRHRDDRRDHDGRRWDAGHRRYYHYHHRGPYGPGYYDYCGYYHGPNGDAGPSDCRYYDGWEPTTSYVADMSADQEVPGPGPAGADGVVYIDVDPDAGRVCYSLDADGPTAVAGSIEQGTARRNGPVVVDLDLRRHGDQGCVPADRGVLHEIVRCPGGFYVELRSADYPAGMMRGQLHRLS